MKSPNRRPITKLRLAVQLMSFVVLIYGGFAAGWINQALVAPGERQVQTLRGQGGYKFVQRRQTTFSMVLPATACIYQREGLCRGCSLYYLSDIFSMQPPLEEFLPLLVLLLIFMLAAGRMWCGWVCPLGLLSDLLTRLRTFLGIEQVRLSPGWRTGLLITKYSLLLLALMFAALAALPALGDQRIDLLEPFCRVCPSRIFAAFFSFDTICWTYWENAIVSVYTVLGLIAFAIFFLGLTIRRFWCRICPVGALTVLFNRTGLVSIVKNGQKCSRCRTCARSCPLDIQAVYEGRGQKLVTAFECTLCMRCVEGCPEPGCLKVSWFGKTIAKS